MPWYIGKFVGRGTHGNPFRVPDLPSGSGFIDIRADGGRTLDGGAFNACLVYSPVPLSMPYIKLGDDETELVSSTAKTLIQKFWGIPQAKDGTLRDSLVDVLLHPPANGMQPVRPSQVTKRLEIHVGKLLYRDTTLAAGSGITGLQITDRVLAQDFLDHRTDRARLLGLFSVSGIALALASLGWLSWSEIAALVGVVLATDAFTDANGTLLTAHDANWVLTATLPPAPVAKIDTNSVYQSNVDGAGYAHYTVTTPNDHYGQGIVAALSSTVDFDLGAACRCTGTRCYFYVNEHLGSNTRIHGKDIDGSFTTWGSATGHSAVGDTMRIEAQGSTITAKKNGATDTALSNGGVQTDTTIASGRGGIYFWRQDSTAATVRWDNFEAGDFTAGGGGQATASLSYHQRSVYNQ